MIGRRSTLSACGLLIAAGSIYYSAKIHRPLEQLTPPRRPPILVSGVDEPEEMKFEPVALPLLTDEQKALAEAVKKFTPKTAPTDILKIVDPVIAAHSNYGDAHTIRLSALCSIPSTPHHAILSEIAVVMKNPSDTESQSVAQSLGMKARIEYLDGHDAEAVSELDKAIQVDIEHATRIFNNGNVAPSAPSESICNWTQRDLGALITKFPTDYRVHLFRGIFYSFFATYDEPSLPLGNKDIQTAIQLNPTSAVLHYHLADLYYSGHFMKRIGSDALKASEGPVIMREFDEALRLNPTLKQALAARAEVLSQAKRYPEAIRDYDALVKLDPENTGAWNDMAITKLNSEDVYGAISNFTTAIQKQELKNKDKGQNENLLSNAYEARGDAYVKTSQYRPAILDYTKALSYQIAGVIYLMNLSQFRRIFPEYASASDEAVTRKINETYFPQFKYDDFAKAFVDPNKEPFETSLIKDLYIKRADARLLAGQFKSAAIDYRRAVASFMQFSDSIDRWRPIQTTPALSIFLDLKSADFTHADGMKVWIKQRPGKDENGPYSVQQFKLNCLTQQIMIVSGVSYDANGNIESSRQGGNWESAIPDTLGETIFNGICPVH